MTSALNRPTATLVERDGNLYLYLALACACIAFVGFLPTYWSPLITGGLKSPPIIHLHAATGFAWSVFLVVQTWLASTGRIASHRSMGLLGVSLATAMVVVGLATAISRMHWAASLNQLEAGRAFAIVPIGAITFFAVIFALAVANLRHRDWHKRLMVVAAASILDAPIARWFIVFLAPAAPLGPPPVQVDLAPSLLGFLVVLLAMYFDWRRHGRVHTAYLIAGSGFLFLKFLQAPISQTAGWHAFAAWLMAFGG